MINKKTTTKKEKKESKDGENTAQKTDDGSKNFKFGIGIGLCERKKTPVELSLLLKI